MKTKEKHLGIYLAALIVLFAMIFVSAEQSFAAEPTVLSVCTGSENTVKKNFTLSELEALNDNTLYTYSRYNKFGSYSKVESVSGPKVKDILEAAGITLNNSVKVTFIGTDNYKTAFTGEQLTEERYYFPNGGTLEKGKAGGAAERAGAEKVPAIISLDPQEYGKLCFGQVAPNERNEPAFNKYMLPENGDNRYGKIVVETGAISNTANDISYTNEEDRNLDQKYFSPGEEIQVSSKKGVLENSIVYYTIDGTEPSAKTSDIFNYQSKNTPAELADLLAKSEPKEHKIKFMTYGYGEAASVKTLTYYVGELKICSGDEEITFSADEMKSMAAQNEEFPKYNYSAYNNKGVFHTREKCAYGPSIDALLDAAHITVDDNQVVTFESSDGYKISLTGKQLHADRYYYPSGNSGTSAGAGGTAASRAKKVRVPAIINLDNGRLCIGQQEPNEQNYPLFIDRMASGIIKIEPEPAAQLKAPASPQLNASELWGSTVSLKSGNGGAKGEKIYYTIDGSVPTIGSDIYNYNTYDVPNLNRTIRIPVGASTFAVKAFAQEYGKQDSPVVTLSCRPVPTAVASLSAASSSYKSAKLSWSRVSGASGYLIKRAASKAGTYSNVKTVTSSNVVSYTNSGLKTGKTYYYKIYAYKLNGSTKIYSSPSAIKGVKVLPSKPSFSLYAGKKSVKIKWKKVTGTNGYVIYQATKKTGKYKAICTKKSGKAGTYTKKNLKGKKTYYYKMRSYRTVNGKKVYSAYTSIKSKKTKK